jgi:hypothetical protein
MFCAINLAPISLRVIHLKKLLAAHRAIAVVAAIGLVFLGATPATAVTWTPEQPLSPVNRWNCGQALATSTSNGQRLLHAVYATHGSSTGVFYRRSTDLGVTWPTSLVIANSSIPKRCPVIATSGATVAVAWEQGEWELGTNTIRLRVSTNHGATFGPERRVATSFAPIQPSLALVGTRILVAWTSGGPTSGVSGVSTSTDRGVTWSRRALDSKRTVFGSRTTQVAASGSRVFAAWLRDDLRTLVGRFSVDGGVTWQPPQVLGTGYDPGPSADFTRLGFGIAARPDRAAIVWTGDWRAPADPGPTLTVRVFAAGSWRAPIIRTAALPAPDHYGIFDDPTVVLLASSRIGLAWAACREDPEATAACDETASNQDVLWSESLDNGASWTILEVAAPGGAAVGGVSARIATPSAIWPSGSFRAILISRFRTVPDAAGRVFLVRGS